MRPELPVLFWLFAMVSTPSRARTYDDWGWPEPKSFHARGFGNVAEVFPPKSRQNRGRKALCYFYVVDYPGTEWKVTAHRTWRAELVNSRMPYEGLVSMDGVLVTLNEHGHVGYENAVVIYDAKGRLVRGYHLDALLTEREMAQVDHSESSRWWTKGAKYYMMKSPAQLYIVVKGGPVLQFSLANGQLRKGTVRNFPGLAVVMRNAAANEATEVWATSLRFSSITDLVQPVK